MKPRYQIQKDPGMGLRGLLVAGLMCAGVALLLILVWVFPAHGADGAPVCPPTLTPTPTPTCPTAITLVSFAASSGAGSSCWDGKVASFYYVKDHGWRVYVEALVGSRTFAGWTVRRFVIGQHVRVCGKRVML